MEVLVYPSNATRLISRIAHYRTIFALTALVVTTLLFVPCSQAVDSPAKPYAGRSIKAGIYNFKPLVYTDTDGTPQGFFVKMLNHVAKKNNWNVQYLPGTWQENMDRLKSGQIDILLCIGYTEERAKFLDFPKEYLVMDWGTIYRAKGSSINSVLDLEGKNR
jgi:ABC-type amino acid transport substrate-binding protein